MANLKISELTAAGALTGAELVELVQGGVNKKSTTQDIADLGGGGGAWGTITGTLSDQTDLDTALDAKAPLDSPTFTTAANAPTPAQGDNDTSIATTAFVNAEIAADAPLGLEVTDTTGTAISFAIPQTYGSVASPETGNITLVTTGLRRGMVQLLLHNNGTEPTYPAAFARLSGTYVGGVLNSIYMHAVSTTRIEYTIFQ